MTPIVSLAISLLPDLAKRVADNVIPDVEKRMTEAVREVLGTEDAAKATQMITDPQIASELRVKLARIEADAEAREAEAQQKRREAEVEQIKVELDGFKARLIDTQNARAMLTELDEHDSIFAWGPVVVSSIVVLGFFWALWLLVAGKVSNGDTALLQIINIVVGALTAGFATVISFWLGSSQGSRKKDTASLQAQNLVAVMQRETSQTTERMVNEQSRRTSELIERVARPPSLPPTIAGPMVSPASEKPKDSRQFHKCMDIILRHEGGFVEHPEDPGGATNMGITHKTLAAWRNVDNCTRDEVRTLQVEEAKEIYRSHYWNALNCDNLPAGVDLVAFDMGVNAGVGRSSRMLQRAAVVEQDGQIGPITVGAVVRTDPEFIVNRFSDIRMDYYRTLKHWEIFGRGWSARTAQTREAALEMLRDRD